MMSLAIIDPSCRYLDLGDIYSYLSKNNIPHIDADLFDTCAADPRCIYFINASDAGLGRHIELIKNAKDTSQWLIVLIDTGSSSAALERGKRDLKMSLHSVDKDISIIGGDIGSLPGLIADGLNKLDRKKSNIILLTSAKSSVGRSAAARSLAKLYPNKTFEICNAADFEDKSQYANHIIVIGNDISDFLLPCPKDVDVLKNVTILFNKIDTAPIHAVNMQKTRRTILGEMNKLGWNLPESFSGFFMGSMLYDLLYAEMTAAEKSYNDFRLSEKYYMWDKYGLPCQSSDYSEESVLSFLKDIYVSDKLLRKN